MVRKSHGSWQRVGTGPKPQFFAYVICWWSLTRLSVFLLLGVVPRAACDVSTANLEVLVFRADQHPVTSDNLAKLKNNFSWVERSSSDNTSINQLESFCTNRFYRSFARKTNFWWPVIPPWSVEVFPTFFWNVLDWYPGFVVKKAVLLRHSSPFSETSWLSFWLSFCIPRV